MVPNDNDASYVRACDEATREFQHIGRAHLRASDSTHENVPLTLIHTKRFAQISHFDAFVKRAKQRGLRRSDAQRRRARRIPLRRETLLVSPHAKIETY